MNGNRADMAKQLWLYSHTAFQVLVQFFQYKQSSLSWNELSGQLFRLARLICLFSWFSLFVGQGSEQIVASRMMTVTLMIQLVVPIIIVIVEMLNFLDHAFAIFVVRIDVTRCSNSRCHPMHLLLKKTIQISLIKV